MILLSNKSIPFCISLVRTAALRLLCDLS